MPVLYNFSSYWTVPALMMLLFFLSSSFMALIFDDIWVTEFFKISDSDISRDFFRYITYSTGLKNWEATSKSICKIEFSLVLLTFMPILTSNIFFSKAFINVVVPIFESVSRGSWNSIFYSGSETVIYSFFSEKTVTVTSKC